MLFLSIFIIVAGILLAVLRKAIFWHDCEMILPYIKNIEWFSTCLDLYVFFSFELLQLVCYWLFYKKWLFCMIAKWFFFNIIVLFFTCLDLYIISFYFIFLISRFVDCFTRNDYFGWLWNDHYLIPSLVDDFLLAHLYVISFHLYYCSWYVICCLIKILYLCMFVKWLLSCIQFIDSFITY